MPEPTVDQAAARMAAVPEAAAKKISHPVLTPEQATRRNEANKYRTAVKESPDGSQAESLLSVVTSAEIPDSDRTEAIIEGNIGTRFNPDGSRNLTDAERGRETRALDAAKTIRTLIEAKSISGVTNPDTLVSRMNTLIDAIYT